MNKCFMLKTTPQGTISMSPHIADMSPAAATHKSTTTSNGHSNGSTGSNGSNGSCACGQETDWTLSISQEQRDHVEGRVQRAYDFFTETLQLYPVNQLIFCFNGGKDCTVLLDLLMRYCRLKGIGSREIPMLYIESDDAFTEIDEFVVECVQLYDVELIKYKDSLKQALTHMTEDMPRIKAVFVGSRNTDPYCDNLQPMQKTDNGWPDMMRLNPLLEWSYLDIWLYIHIYKVPYCKLYAQGYTSIGYKSNTLPNPHLRRNPVSTSATTPTSPPDDDCFKPAWELADPSMERAGRLSKK